METHDDMPVLEFLGHATVALRARSGAVLLVDPYEPDGFGGKMRYAPLSTILDGADYVVASHDHADHAHFASVPEAEIVREGRAGAFQITRIPCSHDEYDGRRRGGSVDIIVVEFDGLRVVHLSDVGQSPTRELVASIGRPDLLLLPVGGYFTIGAAQAQEWMWRLNPVATIPIHYRTSVCDLTIQNLDPFRRSFVQTSDHRSGRIGLTRALEIGGVITLEPQGAAVA